MSIRAFKLANKRINFYENLSAKIDKPSKLIKDKATGLIPLLLSGLTLHSFGFVGSAMNPSLHTQFLSLNGGGNSGPQVAFLASHWAAQGREVNDLMNRNK